MYYQKYKHSRHRTWNHSSLSLKALPALHCPTLPFPRSKTVWKGYNTQWIRIQYATCFCFQSITFKLTGISLLPVCWKASMAWIQPKTGPLSSVEPRPKSFPSRSVNTKGSVSHPSSCQDRYYKIGKLCLNYFFLANIYNLKLLHRHHTLRAGWTSKWP